MLPKRCVQGGRVILAIAKRTSVFRWRHALALSYLKYPYRNITKHPHLNIKTIPLSNSIKSYQLFYSRRNAKDRTQTIGWHFVSLSTFHVDALFLPWICSQSIQNQNTFSRNALHPEKYFCTILCNIISDSRLHHHPHRSNWEYRIMEGEQSLLLLPVQRVPVNTNHSFLCTMHYLQSKCTCELFAHPLRLNLWSVQKLLFDFSGDKLSFQKQITKIKWCVK